MLDSATIRHGKGKYIFASVNGKSDVYVGDWRDDRQYGRGFYLYANGDLYEGEFF